MTTSVSIFPSLLSQESFPATVFSAAFSTAFPSSAFAAISDPFSACSISRASSGLGTSSGNCSFPPFVFFWERSFALSAALLKDPVPNSPLLGDSLLMSSFNTGNSTTPEAAPVSGCANVSSTALCMPRLHSPEETSGMLSGRIFSFRRDMSRLMLLSGYSICPSINLGNSSFATSHHRFFGASCGGVGRRTFSIMPICSGSSGERNSTSFPFPDFRTCHSTGSIGGTGMAFFGRGRASGAANLFFSSRLRVSLSAPIDSFEIFSFAMSRHCFFVFSRRDASRLARSSIIFLLNSLRVGTFFSFGEGFSVATTRGEFGSRSCLRRRATSSARVCFIFSFRVPLRLSGGGIFSDICISSKDTARGSCFQR